MVKSTHRRCDKTHIALIVAVAENGVIGRDGQLPWRMPSDLKTFRRLTMGKPVVMGRKTFQSIGKPLDGRNNIVVTRDRTFAATGVETAPDLATAIEVAKTRATAHNAEEIMILGGGEIFRLAEPLADVIYLTRVHASPAGDAYFETPDPAKWRERERTPLPPDPRDDHAATLIIYQRG